MVSPVVRVTEQRAHISVLVLMGEGTGAGDVVRSTVSALGLVVVISSVDVSLVAIN